MIVVETTTWYDPSPHRITFVTVDNGVKLEALDWGLNGRAVVLLAGYQTAHEYDDIAPKLTAFCHVYGITRRRSGLADWSKLTSPASGPVRRSTIRARQGAMDNVIQVELRTGTTHTLTWLNTTLKPKLGMVVLCKGNPRRWTVVHAYNITAQKTREIRTNWRLMFMQCSIWVACYVTITFFCDVNSPATNAIKNDLLSSWRST
jgi:hypothetical protein